MKRIIKYLFLLLSLCTLILSFSFLISAAEFPAPKITGVTPSADSVTISWSKVKKVYGYRIYKRSLGAKKFKYVASTRSTSFTVKELASDKTYEFRIRVYTKDKEGNKSYGPYCEVFTAKTKLSKPTNLAITKATTDSITIKWDAVPGAEKYKVIYGISGKDGYKTAGTVEGTSITITDLSTAYRYKIKIKAKKKGNDSSYSSIIRLCTRPPKASAPRVKSKDGGSITLEWDKVGRANLYYVYVSSSPDGKYKKAGKTTETTFTCVKKSPKTAYYFKIVPIVSTDSQHSKGTASDPIKAKTGNISIKVPEVVRKGEYPEIVVPYYNSKVKWSSSDKSVIKVSGSRLYAAGTGTVTLTAKYKTFKAKVKVKVTSPTVKYMSAVYNVTDKEYMFKNNINKRCYPASITKLITALVALKYMDEDDIIVVGNELNMVEAYSSRCDIQRGEKFRLKDLLYGLLLPSGGDAAYTIAVNCARKVSGNPNMGYVAAKNYFVSLMNKYMKSIGATGTNCVNPHGYPVKGHYSTVHDLVLVARNVLKNKTLKTITSTPYKYVKSLTGQKHSWGTTNSLIASYAYYYSPYAHGMKTGTVNDEYTGIISAATKNDKTIITVVIGCESYNARYDATHKLLRTYL